MPADERRNRTMDPGSLMEAGWRKSSEAGVIPHPRIRIYYCSRWTGFCRVSPTFPKSRMIVPHLHFNDYSHRIINSSIIHHAKDYSIMTCSRSLYCCYAGYAASQARSKAAHRVPKQHIQGKSQRQPHPPTPHCTSYMLRVQALLSIMQGTLPRLIPGFPSFPVVRP